MGGKTVKKLKQILAFVLICVLFSSTVQAQGIRENEENKYEKIIEMYLNGEDMAEEAVVYRKETAKRLGLEAYLDEKSYLTPEYRFENGIGQDGDITDPDLNILVEMATRKDMEKILEKSQFNQAKPYEEDDRTLVERGFTPGQTVGVTQRKRVSGAGNGYFEISGANSYGYCAQNKKSFWGNDQTKYGPVQEWNDPIVRKILYYSPGGPGYTGGNLGYDMDNATFAVGYQNDSCNNKGRARSYIASLSGKTDPIAWGYRAYIADITPDNYQDIAFLGYIPPAPKQGNVTLKKVSANPSLTNGNSCYSLAGAQFGVYSSSSLSGASRVGTLTTDANGNSNTLKLNAGTYYVKEIVAPKGYALNPETKSVYIPAGGTASVSFADLPQMDPVGILLGKVDAETNQNKPQGSATLQGAQFTVKYYAGLWEANKDPATLGKTPSRTWVFQTDKDGYTSYSKNYLVTGSELYLSSTGHPAIPIGTITIQETKAPEGYLLNPEVFVRQITPSGATENVNTYNKPTIPENIFKLDLKKEQEGTDIPIPGAKFEHTKPDGTKETLTTDENGALTFKALQHGHHAITELEVMDGYVVNENIIEFDVAEDNKVTLTSTTDPTLGNIKFEVTAQGNISLTVEDLLAPFSLKIHKLNNKDKLLAGAEFTLFSDQDCTQEVTKGITDDQGILNFNELKVGQKYYLQETKAPAGYRLPLDENGNLVTYEVYTESTPVKDEFIFYVNGEAFTSDSEGMFTVTGTKADRVAEMTIINNIGMKLPNTGSNTTLLLMMAALILGIILLFRYTLERRRTMKKKTLKMFMALAMSTIVAMGGVTSSIGSLQVQAAETRTTVNTPNKQYGIELTNARKSHLSSSFKEYMKECEKKIKTEDLKNDIDQMIQASFREIFTIYRENFPKIQKYIDEELNADLKKIFLTNGISEEQFQQWLQEGTILNNKNNHYLFQKGNVNLTIVTNNFLSDVPDEIAYWNQGYSELFVTQNKFEFLKNIESDKAVLLVENEADFQECLDLVKEGSFQKISFGAVHQAMEERFRKEISTGMNPIEQNFTKEKSLEF